MYSIGLPARVTVFDLALVLVQQRDRVDQRQVLLVIAARARAIVEEGELVRVRIDHRQRPEQPLGVAMQADDVFPGLPREQAFQRAPGALQTVNRLGLLAVLVHREHQAAVEQLLVDLDRGGGQEDHHRTFDPVLLRHQVARGRILAGRCDSELAFGLQQLERVAGAAGAFLFDDGEDLVLEVGAAHVEQRLPGHGRVFHALFFGHHRQHRIH